MPNWRRNHWPLAIAFALIAGAATAQEALSCGGGTIPASVRAAADEVNRARTDPQGYAKHVAAHFATLQGNRYQANGTTIVLREGRRAVEEAIRFLDRQPPLPALPLSACLSAAAADHVAQQGPTGGFGHRGADGAGPGDRVARRTDGTAYCGENIAYGPGDPRAVVIQLIVDDGVANRGHRRNIFDPRFRSLGVASGPHAKMRAMTVQVFCFNEVRGR
ncbi:CAP domain-containing protein [Pseudooceanicola onchidii]|uniref:CAP domain-containing protein n=1 Tax=Pseudooceanicola onchidii TaxID=2562279 RepID=UPI0010AAC45E|nr:CAP domain-containing protein [Pseudooceanicola onchidii]